MPNGAAPVKQLDSTRSVVGHDLDVLLMHTKLSARNFDSAATCQLADNLDLLLVHMLNVVKVSHTVLPSPPDNQNRQLKTGPGDHYAGSRMTFVPTRIAVLTMSNIFKLS